MYGIGSAGWFKTHPLLGDSKSDRKFNRLSKEIVKIRIMTTVNKRNINCNLTEVKQEFSTLVINTELIIKDEDGNPTDEKFFNCPFCDEQFQLIIELLYSARTETGDEIFKCKICNKQFVVKNGLISHEYFHESNVCNKQFGKKSSLVIHQNSYW